MQEPKWILPDAVYAFHKRQLAEHGGGDGVRDEGLLLSALAKPKNVFAYEENADMAALAAAYAYGIAKNHPFIDGNKRTALVVMRTFLALNGCEFVATDQDKYTTFLSLAEGSLSLEKLTAWIRDHIK